MATISLKLNKNRRNSKGEASLYFQVGNKQKMSSISTGIHIKDEYFLGDPQKTLRSNAPNADAINKELWNIYSKFQERLIKLKATGKDDKMTVVEVKRFLLEDIDNVSIDSVVTFTDYAQKHLQRYTGQSYNTNKRMIDLVTDFFKGKTIFFEDITVGVLRDMDELWGKTMAINSRAIYFRNLRALFNRAIDDEITENYPFRKFQIKSAKKAKKPMPPSKVKQIADLQFNETDNMRELARDIFMLSFYLCGANLKDIYSLTPSNYKNGKISFVRTKVKRFEPEAVEIKLQPEAVAILNKYKGTQYLFSFAEKYKNYETFINNIDKRILLLRENIQFEDLTLYYARYTWATIADKIGIDEKVISKSLGHTPTSVAGKFYISYDWARTDKANRN